MEAASGEPLRFEWVGLPDEGATIADYRWAVDIASVSDNTPRSDELRDYRHWSRRSPLTTSCLLEGLSVGAHLLYIEAADNNGFPSLGIVEIQVVEARFDREVLIVDDTRRELDKFLQADVLDTYKQEWPSATELDTFLFARGGVPWRATQEPLSGETSVPGLFAGYSFDTLGTRLGLEVPSHGVKFSTLTQYRQVVWVVDVTAATYLDIMGARPMSVLAYMCSPSGVNTLGAYLRAGGRVWLCGGGAVTSSIDAFNEERNDLPLDRVYSDVGGELVPGRLLWDAAHWRSSVSAKSPLVTLARSPRAEQIADAPWSHTDYWTAAEVRAPDYRRLPAEFRLRAPELDRLPPTRTARQASSFYSSSTTVEYLFEQNHIVEDVDLSDEGVSMQATLDTVIEARSIALLRNPAPVMTWYHGANVNRFVTTGFAPWALTRADAIAITDFVLQDLWGLSRAPVDRGGSVRPDARAPVTRSRHARTASSQRSPVDPRAAPR
jgi:hypothetical protein